MSFVLGRLGESAELGKAHDQPATISADTGIAARLIARRLGFAPETGFERIGDLLVNACRTR